MAKVTKSLKKSFPSEQKSAFDFDRAVAEAYEMFPHIQGNVFFIDANTRRIVHSDPVARRRLVDAVNKNPSIKKTLNTEALRYKMEKSSACMQMKIGKTTVYFLLFYLEKDLQSALDSRHTLPQNQHLVFDHELAHALIPEAHGHNVRPESTADSYAALRHFQRYGTKTDTIETLMQRRAALAFFNQDAQHFTSQALETTLSFKDQFDFKKLKPEEIVSMAAYIGTKGSIASKDLKSLSYHFNKIRDTMTDVSNDQPLRKFAERVFSARSPAMTKWGKVALQAFLDKKIRLSTDKRRLSLHGPYWDNVRNAM